MIIIRRTASILCRGRLLVFGEKYLSLQSLRGCVEIGRQARLRIWCLRRMGSAPFTRTRKEDAFRCFLQGMCPLCFRCPADAGGDAGLTSGKGGASSRLAPLILSLLDRLRASASNSDLDSSFIARQSSYSAHTPLRYSSEGPLVKFCHSPAHPGCPRGTSGGGQPRR